MLATLPELDHDLDLDPLAEPDNRRAQRKPVARTTGLLYTPGDQKELLGINTTVLNMSLYGVGLKASAPLETGHVLGLEIRGNWMNLCSRIRIISCRKSETSDGFYIGAEFC